MFLPSKKIYLSQATGWNFFDALCTSSSLLVLYVLVPMMIIFNNIVNTATPVVTGVAVSFEALFCFLKAIFHHTQDYIMKLKNASQGISHHTGLSLATENVLRFAGLNPSSVAVSGVFLDKRPNCVKQDSSQLVSGLTFRNRYLGEVNSYSHLPQIKVPYCTCEAG